MKKTIKDFDLKGEKVIIRCDFNVPIVNGVITDDTRIKASLKTIKFAISKGAKVILLSHLGRVNSLEDKEKYSLSVVAARLRELLDMKVIFVPETRGEEVERVISTMKNKDIVLLENTRFEDLKGNRESKNSRVLSKYWASLGDIFINDAFGTLHRKHASTYGIAKILPSGVGLLVADELKVLSKISKEPKRPFVVILGGSKVDDKIGVIETLAKKADYVLICGAMAFTFLKAAGFKACKSFVSEDYLSYCVDILSKYEDKVILPIDVVTAKDVNETGKVKFINEIDSSDYGFDIGPGTVKVFKQYLRDSKTIFWNGPAGYIESDQFLEGTKKLLDVITGTDAFTVIGGGDTASVVTLLGYKDKIKHISTGGGASLELLEGKKLSALDIIDDKE